MDDVFDIKGATKSTEVMSQAYRERFKSDYEKAKEKLNAVRKQSDETLKIRHENWVKMPIDERRSIC